jgi:N-acetyl-1-D-myo-inositol-2-amino-2-deoxy-alpha-D-glucopyranoside deacetylase
MGEAADTLARQTVLAVFAHPDDESLSCGGTLARLADAGAHVVVMCATCGERGSADGVYRNHALGRQRATELREAATALGISEVLLLNHQDGYLPWQDVTDFTAEIALFMRNRRPAAVITFDQDGLYWHPDHIAVHERVVAAARSLGPDAPPVYAVTMVRGLMTEIVDAAAARGWATPSGGFWSLHPDAFGKFATPHTLEVNVGPWVKRKLDAIRAHESQMGQAHPLSELSEPDAVRWLGREFFRRLDLPSRGTTVLEDLCA